MNSNAFVSQIADALLMTPWQRDMLKNMLNNMELSVICEMLNDQLKAQAENPRVSADPVELPWEAAPTDVLEQAEQARLAETPIEQPKKPAYVVIRPSWPEYVQCESLMKAGRRCRLHADCGKYCGKHVNNPIHHMTDIPLCEYKTGVLADLCKDYVAGKLSLEEYSTLCKKARAGERIF